MKRQVPRIENTLGERLRGIRGDLNPEKKIRPTGEGIGRAGLRGNSRND
jgi:hypothetical protein